jgi:hypothetical protein
LNEGDSAVRKTRYLLFADILGTEALYRSKQNDLIERKRTVLGHAVRTAIFPYFGAQSRSNLHINVFSDTVLVASDELAVLLASAAALFYQFSLDTFFATNIDELFLFRGGISYGEVLESESLGSSPHVDVAQIFDTSLSFAYQLERVRKGSRIFLSEETYATALHIPEVFCQKWQAITGIGAPTSPAFEYLWPTTLFSNRKIFGNYLSSLFNTWYLLFTSKQSWEVRAYDQSLYQLDETIKLCIRSAVHCPRDAVEMIWGSMLKLLPSHNTQLTSLDVRFTWGTWFQVLWALLLLDDIHKHPALAESLKHLIVENLRIMRDLKYMPTFLSELNNPDYCWFRERLITLDVL